MNKIKTSKTSRILLLVVISLIVGLGIVSSQTRHAKTDAGIPNTPEAKEIMNTIERAYEIEAQAALTFDLTDFPTVFINDPRFPASPGTLETVRQLTNNPSLKSAGWLDYKIAFYSWRRDATLHLEAVFEKAKKENRGLTDEEKASLIDPYGRTAPARAEGPIKLIPLKFTSINVNGDIATAIVNDGPTITQITLVWVDGQWYIARASILIVNL
jgi:hypothetical protein